MLHLTTIKRNVEEGFTLLEVLLVVAIIAILAGIVIIAINPSKNLSSTRDAQRQADVTTLLNAVYQYELDNNGNLPPAGTGVVISTTATEICKNGGTCTGLIDLNTPLSSTGKYLVSVPIDPSCPPSGSAACNANGNGYKIAKDANGRLTVNAPFAETKTISVSR